MLPVFSLAGLAALSLILDARYASAANDWDTPCLNGSCTYESGDGNVTAYHLMVVVSWTLLRREVCMVYECCRMELLVLFLISLLQRDGQSLDAMQTLQPPKPSNLPVIRHGQTLPIAPTFSQAIP